MPVLLSNWFKILCKFILGGDLHPNRGSALSEVTLIIVGIALLSIPSLTYVQEAASAKFTICAEELTSPDAPLVPTALLSLPVDTGDGASAGGLSSRNTPVVTLVSDSETGGGTLGTGGGPPVTTCDEDPASGGDLPDCLTDSYL